MVTQIYDLRSFRHKDTCGVTDMGLADGDTSDTEQSRMKKAVRVEVL